MVANISIFFFFEWITILIFLVPSIMTIIVTFECPYHIRSTLHTIFFCSRIVSIKHICIFHKQKTCPTSLWSFPNNMIGPTIFFSRPSCIIIYMLWCRNVVCLSSHTLFLYKPKAKQNHHMRSTKKEEAYHWNEDTVLNDGDKYPSGWLDLYLLSHSSRICVFLSVSTDATIIFIITSRLDDPFTLGDRMVRLSFISSLCDMGRRSFFPAVFMNVYMMRGGGWKHMRRAGTCKSIPIVAMRWELFLATWQIRMWQNTQVVHYIIAEQQRSRWMMLLPWPVVYVDVALLPPGPFSTYKAPVIILAIYKLW